MKLRLNEASERYLKFNLPRDEAERIAKSVIKYTKCDFTIDMLYSGGYDYWENDSASLSKNDLYDLMNEAYRLGLEHGIERKVV